MVTYDVSTFEDTINNLNKYTEYTFVIYANTSAGAGHNVTTTARTLEDGKSVCACVRSCVHACVRTCVRSCVHVAA